MEADKYYILNTLVSRYLVDLVWQLLTKLEMENYIPCLTLLTFATAAKIDYNGYLLFKFSTCLNFSSMVECTRAEKKCFYCNIEAKKLK